MVPLTSFLALGSETNSVSAVSHMWVQAVRYKLLCFSVFLLFVHVNLVITSPSTRVQVYLPSCWDLYVSPGCLLRLAFFWVFLPCFWMLILSLPLLGPTSKVTSLSPRFWVYRPRQYDTICWKFDLIFGFFPFSWLIVWADGTNKCGWYLAEGRDADWRASTRSKV